ncbi:hypothetical protein HOB87_00730, partial [Candidatus Woesearchaeota archaeon]|nr:hypothetical protein [Candidatus Woesearchaeota archaeon]MBT7555394.1 hypothetical protein [Candidatus Woesearchaeota archaeon]
EQLINTNEVLIDSLSAVTIRLQIDNDTKESQIKKLSTDLYDLVRWSKEYEQRLENLIDTVESMRLELLTVESSTIPFLQEFGTQDNYIKVFGRTGLRIKDNKVVDAKTIADFEGEITLGSPEIEQLDRYEFKAVYPNREFLNLRIKGGQSEVIKLKPPRNQISIGPVLGVLYNTDTGLTTPTIGVGITYNMIKLWDWK